MKRLGFFLMLAYSILTKCYSVEDRNYLQLNSHQMIEFIEAYFNTQHECIRCIFQKNSSNNCSKYTDDGKTLREFPFYIKLKQKQASTSTTYALMNRNKKIYHLNIFNEKFFPPIAFCLKHLEKLYVHRTNFVIFNHQLPPVIKVWARSLTHLEIYHTTITHLPSVIGNFIQLQHLKLSNTGLVSLPNEIGNLSSLTFLSLADNKLTFLPDTMKNLQSLEQLILTNNSYLRSVEPINGLSLLRLLQMDHCSIERIPRRLSQLMHLSMSYNNLTILTDIETLGYGTTSPKTFNFDENLIESIPSEVEYVRNLSRLNLNHNQLKDLPWSMFNMKTLDYLFIKNNNFNEDDLKQIVKIFKDTNPKLILSYLNDKNSSKKF